MRGDIAIWHVLLQGVAAAAFCIYRVIIMQLFLGNFPVGKEVTNVWRSPLPPGLNGFVKAKLIKMEQMVAVTFISSTKACFA